TEPLDVASAKKAANACAGDGRRKRCALFGQGGTDADNVFWRRFLSDEGHRAQRHDGAQLPGERGIFTAMAAWERDSLAVALMFLIKLLPFAAESVMLGDDLRFTRSQFGGLRRGDVFQRFLDKVHRVSGLQSGGQAVADPRQRKQHE